MYSEKVDVNAKDVKGNTPLHNAVNYGCLEVARLLMDSSLIKSGADITKKNNRGETAMDLALKRHDKWEVVQVLEDAAATNEK
jgi:ankyrin repeat protein